jgi:hypothetical protein
LAYTGPLVQLELSFTRFPWRIAPMWAVVAGATAGGLSFVDPRDLLRLLGSVVLADVAWGILRHYAEHSVMPALVRVPAVLPYATADSPLARALAALALPGREDRAGWQGALVGLTLTTGLSVLLGWEAGFLSLAALSVMWVTWLVRGRGDRPVLSDAVLDVGLPGLLGLALAGLPVGEPPWVLLGLGAAFVGLHWAALRWTYTVTTRRIIHSLLWAAFMLAAFIIRL